MRDFVKAWLYLTLFSVALVPLFFADYLYFPAITGKAIYFYAIIQLSLVLYATHLFIEKRPIIPNLSWISIAVLVLVGAVGVSSFLSGNVAASIYGNFERMDGWITLLHLGIFFFLTITLFTKEKIWDRFFLTSLGVSVLVFLTAFAKYIEIIGTDISETRVDVLLGNATFLGTYAMLHFFLAGYLAVKHYPWSLSQRFLVIVALLNIVTIVFSGTRAALLGLLVGVGIAFLIYFFRTDRLPIKSKLLITMVICIATVVSVGAAYQYRAQLENVPIVGRLLQLTPDTITEQPRYFIWKAAINGYVDKPVLGWGADQFLNVYGKHYNPETKSRFNVAIGETWIDRTHNMYLEWLIAGGPIALASYLFLFGYAIYIAFTRFRSNVLAQSVLVGLFGAYMFNNLFAFDSLSSYLVFFLLLGYMHFNANSIKILLKPQSIPSFIKKGFAVGITIFAVWAMTVVTIPSYSTAHTLAEFLKAEDGSQKQLNHFETLTQPNVYAPWHVNTAVAEEVRVISKAKAAAPSVVEKMMETVIGQIEYDVAERSPDARALFLYCRVIRHIGDIELAKELCEQAAEKAPNTQDVLIELGQIYRDLEMYQESFDTIEHAFVSEPEYDPVRPEYAAALIYIGESKQAYESLNQRYGTHLVDDKSLLMAYVHIEAFADALQIIDKHIKKEPREIGYHLSRASIYLKLDQKELAISAVEDLMREDESLEKAGEKIIKQIEFGEDVLGSNFNLE